MCIIHIAKFIEKFTYADDPSVVYYNGYMELLISNLDNTKKYLNYFHLNPLKTKAIIIY